jgi:magnesium-transporting ATPase (P-type)
MGFLATIVVTQMFNVFACRTNRTSVFSKGLFSNRMIWVGIATEVLLIIVIAYVPFVQKIFGTSPFPPYYFLWMIGFGAIILGVEELRKYMYRKYNLFGIE